MSWSGTSHFGSMCWSWKEFSNCEGICLEGLSSSAMALAWLLVGSRSLLLLLTSSTSPAFVGMLAAEPSLFILWPSQGGWVTSWTVFPPRASTLLSPVILMATLTACSTVSWAFPMVVRASAFATGFLERAFLKRLRQSTCFNQRIGVVTGGCYWVSLLVYLVFLAGSFMCFCHLNHMIIRKLLSGIVNKLLNLKVSSSMIKKVYLKWLLFLLGKLAPSYQVLDVDVQFSHGLVLGLLDVWQIFISDLPVTRTLLKAIGKGLEYGLCIVQLVLVHLVIQGCPSLRCFFATIEQDMCDLCCLAGCQQSQSTAPTSPCRRPMLLACPQHSSPSWESCLLVHVSPSWLDPRGMPKSASRKYFTLGGCCSPESKIFLFGRMWQSCNDKASHGQINGSIEIMLGVYCGGTVLFLLAKQEEAETINIHPRRLGNIWEGVVVLNWVRRWLTERHWLNWCYLLLASVIPIIWQWETHTNQLSPEISVSLNLSCHHVVGANKDRVLWLECGLLTKCQYCTGMCIYWCLLLNCPSGRKWLLYTVALWPWPLGYDSYYVT